jgi:hypothetical protein
MATVIRDCGGFCDLDECWICNYHQQETDLSNAKLDFYRTEIGAYNIELELETSGIYDYQCCGESKLLHGLDTIPTPIQPFGGRVA